MSDGLQMRYFILKPSGNEPHHAASRAALAAYAESIRSTNLQLADDLLKWVIRETPQTT